METTQHKGEQQHQTPEKCKSPTQDVKEWTPFCEDELKPKEGLEFANLKEYFCCRRYCSLPPRRRLRPAAVAAAPPPPSRRRRRRAPPPSPPPPPVTIHAGNPFDIPCLKTQILGREPTCEELFKDTHCKVKDKAFVDKKSAKKYEDHQNKWQEYSQTASQGGSQLPPMTQEEFWIKENLDKKGRVYGFGAEGVKLKKSATIAAARHSSAEHFDPRQQAQLFNESITKQAEAITQIAKKQGKTERMLKKVLRFFKGQSAGSSSQINLNPDDEEDSEDDNDDDPTNLSDSE